MVVFLLFQAACFGQDLGHWDNDFDGSLRFRCSDESYGVTEIKSYHDNHHEDRRFDISCSQVRSTASRKSCYWTNYVNEYEDPINYTCRTNYYINGMNSVHSDDHEDRAWKFRCCHISGVAMEDCHLSGWTNKWDKYQDYSVPTGHVVTGMVAVHNNKKEDRQYEYMACKVGERVHPETFIPSGVPWSASSPRRVSASSPRRVSASSPRRVASSSAATVQEFPAATAAVNGCVYLNTSKAIICLICILTYMYQDSKTYLN